MRISYHQDKVAALVTLYLRIGLVLTPRSSAPYRDCKVTSHPGTPRSITPDKPSPLNGKRRVWSVFYSPRGRTLSFKFIHFRSREELCLDQDWPHRV